MSKRKLLDGTEATELDTAVFMIVKTKCPEKWRLIDDETGEEYRGHLRRDEDELHWKKLNN
jgi:hypothetical protein